MSELRDGAFNDMTLFELKRKTQQDRNATTAASSRNTTTTTLVGEEEEQENVTIRGAYVIVDNGYLTWPTTIPPMKDTCNRSELRFSQWLEPLRKDVECTFGILKGRWRILKTGIRVHNTDASDNIWLTCCALHNHLLDVDGLSHKWEDGVPSFFEKEGGMFSDEDIPTAIRRLLDPTGNQGHRLASFDGSGFGFRRTQNFGDDDHENDYPNEDTNQYPSRLPLVRSGSSVNLIEFNQFRAMLIENFNIAFHKNELKWPKRFARNTMPVPIL